jgi:hypothetical protein
VLDSQPNRSITMDGSMDTLSQTCFVFSACCRIIACVLNVPGSVHDSTLAEWGGIYTLLETTYQRTSEICCADSAFAALNNAFIIRSAQDVTQAETELEVVQMEEATALQQASEWGMRAIQGVFPRLKDTIKFKSAGEDDEELEDSKLERRLMLKLVVLL